MKTQVAAQMYTVREFMKTPADMDVSCVMSGYDAVCSGGGPIDPADMRALLDKHELTVAATHIQFDKIKNDTEGDFRSPHTGLRVYRPWRYARRIPQFG